MFLLDELQLYQMWGNFNEVNVDNVNNITVGNVSEDNYGYKLRDGYGCWRNNAQLRGKFTVCWMYSPRILS